MSTYFAEILNLYIEAQRIEILPNNRSPVGAVSNRTGLECLINSKIYTK